MKSNELDSNEFVNLLMNQEITVYEDIQGTQIWCNYENGKWNIRPKSIKNKPINLIDLAMQKMYKYVYSYLLSLPDEVTNLLRSNVYFGFEYFPDSQPANIKYNDLPKNRLILTSICRNGRKYIYNIDELKVYSDLLKVEMLPVIYSGKLSSDQIKKISTYLSLSKEDLSYLEAENNFAEYFYNLLNPQLKNSYLNDSFQDNLEKLIIRFERDYKTITMEILNPLYKRNDNKIQSNYSNIYSILIFNFLEFIQNIEISELKITGRNREMIYINMMCSLYNLYMKHYEEELNELEFVIPNFFNGDKFKINQSLIKDETTLNYINNSVKNEYLLKIILNTFRHRQKKTIGIFTEITLKYLNDMIRTLHVRIEEQFNYNQNFPSYTIKKDLSKYPNIQWEEDHRGFVKTTKGKLFDEQDPNNKKKKFKNEQR